MDSDQLLKERLAFTTALQAKPVGPTSMHTSGCAGRKCNMGHNSSRHTHFDSQADKARPSGAKHTVQKQAHASHRTPQGKLRGLAFGLPGTDGPVEVCVNNEADWKMIHLNRAVHLKCLDPSCDTKLIAKRMGKSGLRFLAANSGACSHNEVDISGQHQEVAQAPATPGGGGPEGGEHHWIKNRLYRIATKLGADAVVEHSPTHGDVFLPEHKIVLEYQRWDTNFTDRTRQRASAGVAKTIWLFPSEPPDGTSDAVRKKFAKVVFQDGGVYVSVLNPSRDYERLRPWEDAKKESKARLFASGSITRFDLDRQALIYSSRSMAQFLKEIINGERILQHAPVWKKGKSCIEVARVWVLQDDLTRAEEAQEKRRRASQASSITPAVKEDTKTPRSVQDSPTDRKDSPEQTDSQSVPDNPISATLNVAPPIPSELVDRESDATTDPNLVPDGDVAASKPQKIDTQKPKPQQEAERRPWWKKLVGWLRQP